MTNTFELNLWKFFRWMTILTLTASAMKMTQNPSWALLILLAKE